MNLTAYPRTVNDILTLNRKYIVPRFQREYSWEEVEHTSFWKDICSQIQISGKEITFSDYFIGALVLVGDDAKDVEFQIVDGQQRLTTITIIFSALAKRFLEIKEEGLARSCYSYVEGKDSDYKPYFKLENENPKPFLQKEIQFVDIELKGIVSELKPSSIEEEKLQEAFTFYYDNFSEKKLKELFGGQHEYSSLLKGIRDQLLKLKTIFITVNSIEEAYTIFETLNAKGKDLQTIDLIKNKVFKLLDTDHPDDDAKTKWGIIKKELSNRSKRVNPSTFLRHYWISKYEFVTESKIYESFSKKIPEKSSEYKLFLDDLVEGAKEYNKVANPSKNDWKTVEEKGVYYSLMALITFNVVQPRPFILALLDARKRKVITINHVREALLSVEKFHFLFSAVSSSRASGLEGKYSTLARKLRRSKSKADAKAVLKELDVYFESKKPTLQVFIEGFNKLEFLNDKTSDKKLIQYIFFNIEKKKYSTEELIPYNLTIEHIYPQSKESINKGKIGNLIPLALEINEVVKIWGLDKKLPEFAKSELKTVKEFVEEYSEKERWTDELTDERTNMIAEHAYNVVWRLDDCH